MPKKITTYQIVRVFGDDQQIFKEDSLLPNIPRRFAIVKKTSNSATKPELLVLAEPDQVLHWLAIITMTDRNETRVEGVSRYFTESEFSKYASAKLDLSNA